MPRADAGEAWAVNLLSWLFNQQGVDGFLRAAPLASKAAAMGMPWMSWHVFNNMIANVGNAPQLLEPAMKLMAELSWPGFTPIDLVGQAWNLLAGNQDEAALRILSARSSGPLPPDALQPLLEDSRAKLAQFSQAVAGIQARASEVDQAAEAGIESIQQQEAEMRTRAQQATLLASEVTSNAIGRDFEADAERNLKEAADAWRLGIRVLAAAAFVAVLPLILHYLRLGADFSAWGLGAAHAGSSAALGTVAGVLLGRSRARNRASQRSRDLAIALGVAITYSSQIINEDERQRFMLTMTEQVLQAHLTQGAANVPNTDSNEGSSVASLRPEE